MNNSRHPQSDRRNYDDNRQRVLNLPPFKDSWITTGADDNMINYVDKLGEILKQKNVSSSQLRNVYGEVMRIKMKGYQELKTDFILLKPKVAYNYGRIKAKKEQEGFKSFVDTFNKAHALVKDEKTFDNFQKFFEAILAYHKFYGGK